MKSKHCQWCDNQFQSSVSYQIYCSVECRELATKEKIAERYAIKRREALQKKKRFCKSCGLRLSAYNDETLCQNCPIDPKEVSRTIREIRGYSDDGKSKKNKPKTK
jgi:hypothetical protein